MRDLIKKATMVAGAALLVTACGGGEDATANNTAGNFADESLMGNDISTVDTMNGAGNMTGTDMNMTGTTGTTGTDMNMTTGTGNTTGTDMNMTTGTGNTTGTTTGGNTTGM